ncbi:hypothetical protein [Pseudomonas sp. SCB32]|uniref:hypothetical protein n=1 Tax=Pseudomonas sp. SCB32 TaxID=2653853 RepID=UPI0012640B63|nr:hypothetical protein [Pseudomonas sp. SCB32]
MKVFVVANDSGRIDPDVLVRKLHAIQTPNESRNSVIAVDSFYNLQADAQIEGSALKCFRLDDFMHRQGSVADGKVVLDTNRIAEQVGAFAHEWLVIDFGQHEFDTGEDFISKLATCFFMVPTASELKLVFAVTRVQLPLYLRTCNTAFNVLPEGRNLSSSSTQTDMLFLSVAVEKVYTTSSPILWPLARLREIASFFYNRIIRSRA